MIYCLSDDDTWRKKTALILVARQNGKTHLARMLILSHLFLWGSKNVLGMSSNRNMALDTFRQVAYTIEDNQFLKDQVRQIRLANGQESIAYLMALGMKLQRPLEMHHVVRLQIFYILMNYVNGPKKPLQLHYQ
jgi:phage terminase large subunit-like protein